jgi:hypothetical protein
LTQNSFYSAASKQYWPFALIIIIFLGLFVLVEENFSSSFAKCTNNWNADHVSYQRNYYSTLAEITGGHTLCIVKAIDRHNGVFAAIAAFVVAWFTFSLREATDRLWLAGENQR